MSISTPQTMSRFHSSIKERSELVADYRRMGERLKEVNEATAQNGRVCEQCGRPSSNRLCSNECYAAHYARLEDAATLPVEREPRAAPPRSSPDK